MKDDESFKENYEKNDNTNLDLNISRSELKIKLNLNELESQIAILKFENEKIFSQNQKIFNSSYSDLPNTNKNDVYFKLDNLITDF